MSEPEAKDKPSNFIRDAAIEDLKSGRYKGIVTRFPPEPNGYLHIGHAKAICLDFGLALEFGGRCHLRFDQLYEWAEALIKKGLAYVDDLTPDQVAEYRGTLTVPGRESPYRNRSVEENLDLFRRMRAGEFPDGSKTLRAKIDMAAG